MVEKIEVKAEQEREPIEPGSVLDRACRWIVGEDTGTSSIAIWSVMMGVHTSSSRHCTPSDPSDFGRCVRLLKLIPEWEDNLDKLRVIDFDRNINGVKYPKVWSSFVDNYWKMKRLYIQESNLGQAPKLYKLMHSLGL